MTTAPLSSDWEKVDAAADPASLAQYLDAVTAME